MKKGVIFAVLLAGVLLLGCVSQPQQIMRGVPFSGNGHRYEVVNEPMTWETAMRYAERRGGYLATITSEEVNTFVMGLIRGSGTQSLYWLGGKLEGNQWEWVTSEPFSYTNWAASEPSDSSGRENRLVMYNRIPSGYNPVHRSGQWNDERPSIEVGCIIEYPAVAFNRDDQWYEIVNERMTWENARRYAEQRGGHLATITSAEESAFILEQIQNSGTQNLYWLGGKLEGTRWGWVTGEPFSYINWALGQPDNAGNSQDKLVFMLHHFSGRDPSNFRPGEWDDDHASASRAFVIEYSAVAAESPSQEPDEPGEVVSPPAVTAPAQSGQKREDIWISAGVEAAQYSYSGLSLGGSVALGYGSGTSIGLKASWYFLSEGANTLELNFLFRFYLSGSQAISGPFLQFTGGPAFFFPKEENMSLPVELGMFSAGLNLGWRFLLNNLLFFEPSIRIGYPYILGGGISAGIRF